MRERHARQIFLMACVAGVHVFGTHAAGGTLTPHAGLSAADTALLRAGISNLYLLDLARAEQQFARVATVASNNAAGHAWHALAVLGRIMVEGPARMDEERIRQDAQCALAAHVPLRTDGSGWRELYDGIAMLLLTRHAVAGHDDFGAVMLLGAALRELRAASIAPAAAADAAVLLGAYETLLPYTPWYLRLPASVVAAPGDEAAGLARLEHGALRADMLGVPARAVLAIMYAWREQYDRALHVCDQLQAALPANHQVDALRAQILMREGRVADATAALTRAIVRVRRDPRPGATALLAEHYYDLGRLALLVTNYPAARAHFDAAYAASGRKQTMRAWALLRLGTICDLLQQRRDAQQQYARAAENAATAPLVRQYAALFAREPYAGQCLE
jgi:tetratricopeptide (TPR) repeat protein